jgi:hypothetical protein
MRIQPFHVLVATLGAATLLLAGVADNAPHISASTPSQATNAAYRDGMYLAKLDVQNGRKPHLITGRWSNAQDRASFLEGYQQAYSDQVATMATSAELSGYRDGLVDGSQHRKSDRPFRAGKTENYRSAGSFSGRAETRNYRLAYANGYQQGYYSNAVDFSTVSQISNRF